MSLENAITALLVLYLLAIALIGLFIFDVLRARRNSAKNPLISLFRHTDCPNCGICQQALKHLEKLTK